MATVDGISNTIGEYMLKGWVLTDTPCPRCKNIPLMRSPKNQVPIMHFCANCDGNAQKVDVVRTSSSSSLTNASSTTRTTVSRSSTPATEISDVPSSPTFVIPAETPESRRRREQSDRASAEIGNRLLKGWALLGEECINETCFGIPLVRAPKSGNEKNPNRECVICGRVYVGEGDLVEAEVSQPQPSAQISSIPTHPVETSGSHLSSTVTKPRLPTESDNVSLPSLGLHEPIGSIPHPATSIANESTLSALNITTHTLEQTLITLSGRLSSSVGPTTFIDPQTISLVVDTITETTHALAEVKKLERIKRGV
ncbi:hypothetical protein C8R42DRAFT_608584 [Lentinula raphanica]|nr:hypothetical protein C8R42DRAFT_608584 [Lentinula raphanica]